MQTLDSLTLHFLASDCHSLTEGAKLTKIQHVSQHEWILFFWGARRLPKLYINLSPDVAAAWLTDDVSQFSHKTFQQPTGLCLLLRKHLLGAKVQDVRTIPGERVWIWHFDTYDELGQPIQWQLILELMGKHSNMLLVQPLTQEILGLAHSVSEVMSQWRPLRPGGLYCPPPRLGPEKLNLFDASHEDLLQHFNQEGAPAANLQAGFWGCSQTMWSTILPNESLPTDSTNKVLSLLGGQGLQPAIQRDRLLFSLAPESIENWEPHPSVVDMVRCYFEHRLRRSRIQQRQHQLVQHLLNKLKKRQRQLDYLTGQLASHQDCQILADQLMMALSLKQLPEQVDASRRLCWQNPLREGEVIDIHLPLELEQMPPHQSWMCAIQTLYARAKKQKIQQHVLSERCALLQMQQQADLDGLCLVRQADDWETLLALAQEIMPVPLKVKQKGKQPTLDTEGVSFRRVSIEAAELFIGKTQQANASLLSRYSRPNDWWFHARQMAGSHVICKLTQPQSALTTAQISEAARWAAYYSEARASQKVPVIYTQCRFVRPIPNSYPGHVTYREEQEVLVQPIG